MKLELLNVSFRYNNSSRYVLKNVSVRFEPFQLNVIIGLNGAGKTTLFDLIAGVLPRPDGFINVPPEKDILYQLQSVPFLVTLKGRDIVKLLVNVDFRNRRKVRGPLITDSMDAREAELMKRLWNVKYGDMSIGERRWLLITALCEMKRKLYLFDEPTSGIDPDSRIKIFRRLELLSRQKNCLVLVSSHNLHELEFVRCKLFLLHEGKIIFQGSYQDFLKGAGTNNPDIAFQRYVKMEVCENA